MQKHYDEFVKMKPKEMSKAISDMTYTYINPETNTPTIVPQSHYEKFLNRIKEQYISEVTKKVFLQTMYTQLKLLKDEEPKLFQKALICLDLNMKPNDLRINEEIALSTLSDALEEKEKVEKKNFHMLDKEILDFFEMAKNDIALQTSTIRKSNEYEENESIEL